MRACTVPDMDTTTAAGHPTRTERMIELRAKLAAHEQVWQELRAQSRALAIELITVEQISMLRTAELSGHHRATIKTWLDIHNAEVRGQQREKG